MASRALWAAVAAGSVLLVGGAFVAARRERRPAIAAAKGVALIGDSYAVGLGPELAKLLPNFKYEGHVGTTTGGWAAHVAACGQCGDWLTTYKPDTVLVSLGVNDGMAPNPAHFQRIVQALNSIGAHVVWIEPPAAVKTASRSVIESLGVPVVPATRTPLAGDGLHPKSYAQWAQEVAQAVV